MRTMATYSISAIVEMNRERFCLWPPWRSLGAI
jgi:hypothetical protein